MTTRDARQSVTLLSRRDLLGSGAACLFNVGCGGGGGGTDSLSLADTVVPATPGLPSETAPTAPPVTTAATNKAPVWRAIPQQTWAVGVPVELDLAQYCSDPDNHPLVFSVEGLPAGLSLVGSVIRGTPSVEVAVTEIQVAADDQQ